MSNFNPSAGQVVADDLRSAFNGIDMGVQNTARLVNTFIEGYSGSDLAPSRSQRALKAMAISMTRSIESRESLIDAQRALVAIKGDSNLDVYDFGCWMGNATSEPARASSQLT